MPHHPAPPAVDPAEAEASRLRLLPRILRLAGGDADVATRIRGLMWAEYCEAGAPLGVSEDGMYVWWDEALGQ